jgi:hypothetical protein
MVLAYMVMLLSISGAAVAADVCDIYAQFRKTNVMPSSFEAIVGTLGKNCSVFSDIYAPLTTVRALSSCVRACVRAVFSLPQLIDPTDKGLHHRRRSGVHGLLELVLLVRVYRGV